jgi:hypothetical protein
MNSEEWIEWGGGDSGPKVPVTAVKFRSGEVDMAFPDMFWGRGTRGDSSSDIVAFQCEGGVRALMKSLGYYLGEEEHTGLSVNYYGVHVADPTSGGEPYDAECNDIIEALGMTFAEANVFKAIWRIAASRQGKRKKGNNTVYDAEKCVFFSARVLKNEKKNVQS